MEGYVVDQPMRTLRAAVMDGGAKGSLPSYLLLGPWVFPHMAPIKLLPGVEILLRDIPDQPGKATVLLLGFVAKLLQKILREGYASPLLVLFIHRLVLLAHAPIYTPNGEHFVQISYPVYDFVKLYTTFGV